MNEATLQQKRWQKERRRRAIAVIIARQGRATWLARQGQSVMTRVAAYKESVTEKYTYVPASPVIERRAMRSPVRVAKGWATGFTKLKKMFPRKVGGS